MRELPAEKMVNREAPAEVKTLAKTPPKAPRARYNIIDPPKEGRVAMFLRAFAAVLKYSGYKGALDAYSRLSTGCARCSAACHIYRATGDDKDIPCYRTYLLLDIYRRYFTLEGQVKSLVLGGRELCEADIDLLAESFYRCNACRRCSLECPMGIDQGLMTHLGRYILSEMGIVPKALRLSAIQQMESPTHTTTAMPAPALEDFIRFLEAELLRITGQPIKFPVDQPGREFIFFAPASDFLMEAETLMGHAALMHAVGFQDRWTIGTHDCDAMNFGLYYNDWVLDHVVCQLCGEAERLRARQIMIGECGHAARTAKEFVPVFGRDLKRPVKSTVEFAAEMLKQGKLRLNPDAISARVTYHDPCNLARSGWIVEQPRELLRAMAKNFVEMTPHGRWNYCCGGGGGAASIDEIHDFRMETAGRVKAEQLKATGADLVVAPCAECKKQLRELVRHYSLKMEVVGLNNLLLKAIRYE